MKMRRTGRRGVMGVEKVESLTGVTRVYFILNKSWHTSSIMQQHLKHMKRETTRRPLSRNNLTTTFDLVVVLASLSSK